MMLWFSLFNYEYKLAFWEFTGTYRWKMELCLLLSWNFEEERVGFQVVFVIMIG